MNRVQINQTLMIRIEMVPLHGGDGASKRMMRDRKRVVLLDLLPEILRGIGIGIAVSEGNFRRIATGKKDIAVTPDRRVVLKCTSVESEKLANEFVVPFSARPFESLERDESPRLIVLVRQRGDVLPELGSNRHTI